MEAKNGLFFNIFQKISHVQAAPFTVIRVKKKENNRNYLDNSFFAPQAKIIHVHSRYGLASTV